LVGAVKEDGVAILSDVLQIGDYVGVEVAASGHVNLLDSLSCLDSLETCGVGGLYGRADVGRRWADPANTTTGPA
jgi:hypothetical protein